MILLVLLFIVIIDNDIYHHIFNQNKVFMDNYICWLNRVYT